MSTNVLFFFLIPLAIASMLAFGAMMKIATSRMKWNPRSTFWISTLLYGFLGYAIPLLLLNVGYSDLYYYWMFFFIGAAPIYLIVYTVLKRKERQKNQEPKSVAQDDQSRFHSTNTVSHNQIAKQPSKSARPTPVTSERGEESPSQAKTTHIFVSYRRSDSADIAGRVYDRLIGRFGKDPVFKDVDSIPLGLDFKEYLDKKVGECDVLLAIIGDHWLDASDPSGTRRLDDPSDFVRIEIESALERGIPVIPLLVRGAQMPREESLPPTLRKLVYRNGILIRSDPDFHRDMDRLISALEKYTL
jgi:hypothetical protein